MYNKPFPHYYDLAEIYGRDRATGANVGTAEGDEEEMRHQDANQANMASFMGDMNMESQFDCFEDFEMSFTQKTGTSQLRKFT